MATEPQTLGEVAPIARKSAAPPRADEGKNSEASVRYWELPVVLKQYENTAYDINPL